MNDSLFVYPPTPAERARLELEASAASQGGTTHEVCQIILASARRETVSQIAMRWGCAEQTVADVIRTFNRSGLEPWFSGASTLPKLLESPARYEESSDGPVLAAADRFIETLMHWGSGDSDGGGWGDGGSGDGGGGGGGDSW